MSSVLLFAAAALGFEIESAAATYLEQHMSSRLSRKQAPPPPGGIWYCRDGPDGLCNPFSWGEGGYTAKNYGTDSEEHASAYCMSKPKNEAIGDGDTTDIFGCTPQWYYCRDASTLQCSSFRYGDGSTYDLPAYTEDNETNAKDYCMSWPPNVGKNCSELDLFGNSTCPDMGVSANKQGVEPGGRNGLLESSQGRQRGRLVRREDNTQQELLSRMVHPVSKSFYCFNDGPELLCNNVTADFTDQAQADCIESANKKGDHFTAAEVFGRGDCPAPPMYHCMEGNVMDVKPCHTFSFDDGGTYGSSDAAGAYEGESVANARDWCVTQGYNNHTLNFSDVFGKGACPPKPVYHCLAGLGGACSLFSYTDGDGLYSADGGFATDSEEQAKDYCMNSDANTNAEVEWKDVGKVFGLGPCPVIPPPPPPPPLPLGQLLQPSGEAVTALELGSRGTLQNIRQVG